jgi:hypothetical protein
VLLTLLTAVSAAAEELRILLPAVARVSGEAGTVWRSDAVVLNPGPEAVTFRMSFLERGRSTPEPEWFEATLPVGASMEFSDIVHTVFGRIGTAGTVVIDPDAVVVASARTWTTSGAGGYGQFVAGVPVADRHGVYQSLLPQLTDDQRYRTNFGLVNLGYDQLHAWVAPVVFDGEDPKPRMERIPAWGCADFSGRLAEPGDPVSDALILVEIEFLPGPHFAWASVVDNATGDAIFIPPVAPAGETLVIPAAAHAPGVGGAQWRTDLEVVGDPFLPVEYRLEWWPAAGGGAVSSVELSLSPGEAHRHEDVVATVLERHGAGAIAVVFTQGEALVSSRTFVQAPGGTYGQYVPRMPEAEALAPGVNGWLTPLRGGAEFRSNIGLVNPDDDQVSVTVSILDTAGAVVAEFTREVPGRRLLQVNGALEGLTVAEPAAARVHVVEGRVFAWASVVDNASGDPIFIPAVARAASDP